MDCYSNAAVGLALAVIALTTLIWFLRKLHHIARTRKNIILDERQDGVFRRPLGPIETKYYHLQKHGIEIASTLFMITSKMPCSEQLLGNAVALLVRRHPLLRTHLISRECGLLKKPTLFFVETENPQIEMDVDRVTTSWRTKLEAELLKTFPDGGPLWRVTYLPKTTKEYSDELRPYQHCFVFTFHHAVIDGTAISKLMAEFLEFVEQLHQRFDEEIELTSLPLPPTAEEVVGHIIMRHSSWFHKACIKVLSFTPLAVISPLVAKAFKGRNKWMTNTGRKFRKNCPLNIKKTSNVLTVLPEADMNMLVHRCRKESVTFLSAFTAATALAWREMLQRDLPAHQQKAPINIEIKFTVDLRRRFLICENSDVGGSRDPNTMDHVALLIASLPTTVSVNEPTEEYGFWDLARQYKSSIHTNMDQRISDSLYKLELYNEILKKIPSSGLFECLKIDEGRNSDDMSNNNLGKIEELNRPEDSPFKASALFMCSAGHGLGATLHNRLITFDNRLFWTTSYFTNVMCKEDAEEFVSRTKHFLKDAIKG